MLPIAKLEKGWYSEVWILWDPENHWESWGMQILSGKDLSRVWRLTYDNQWDVKENRSHWELNSLIQDKVETHWQNSGRDINHKKMDKTQKPYNSMLELETLACPCRLRVTKDSLLLVALWCFIRLYGFLLCLSILFAKKQLLNFLVTPYYGLHLNVPPKPHVFNSEALKKCLQQVFSMCI